MRLEPVWPVGKETLVCVGIGNRGIVGTLGITLVPVGLCGTSHHHHGCCDEPAPVDPCEPVDPSEPVDSPPPFG